MYFTSWYTAAFHSATVRELTYLALLAAGFAFFWTLLRVDPVPKEYSYAVSMWITGALVVGDAFLGIAVIADQNLIGAAYYHALARPWGPTLRADQVIGGGALWILGNLVGLPFLAAQLIQLMREDESDATAIDADLDARDAERQAAAAAREGEPGQPREGAGRGDEALVGRRPPLHQPLQADLSVTTCGGCTAPSRRAAVPGTRRTRAPSSCTRTVCRCRPPGRRRGRLPPHPAGRP